MSLHTTSNDDISHSKPSPHCFCSYIPVLHYAIFHNPDPLSKVFGIEKGTIRIRNGPLDGQLPQDEITHKMAEQLSLYGGAISTIIPRSIKPHLVDVSHIRQIPDTQEVYIVQDTRSNAKFDKSLIFDLLERVPDQKYEDAIAIHLQDIVESDEPATNHFIEAVEKSSDGSSNSQVVVNFSFIQHKNTRRDAKEEDSPVSVITFIALLRLETVETDVLITLNVPLSHNVDAEEFLKYLGSSGDVNEVLEELKTDYLIFRDVGYNYVVEDWGLFGM
ncbi:uncharacterized protein RJT20DRAFT_30001 [Scheffersomyces xylosifermentans]|uniref:uncharacterized protein n=1 Tax=Scheffersomyces xylosifermentans TaxID=1304137 RepID=UPI00315D34AB